MDQKFQKYILQRVHPHGFHMIIIAKSLGKCILWRGTFHAGVTQQPKFNICCHMLRIAKSLGQGNLWKGPLPRWGHTAP